MSSLHLYRHTKVCLKPKHTFFLLSFSPVSPGLESEGEIQILSCHQYSIRGEIFGDT